MSYSESIAIRNFDAVPEEYEANMLVLEVGIANRDPRPFSNREISGL